MKQSDYIHFVEGFLLTPGYIDLSELLIVATKNSSQIQEESSSSSSSSDPTGTSSSSSKNYDNKNTSSSGTNFYMDGSALDIAVFHLVS